MRSERIASAVGLPRPDVALSTRIELAYRGRQPRILTRGLREQVSELRESNPHLRFVGPRPSHWTKLGYRRWVLAPRDRAYETQLRAGAAGAAPTRGVEPLDPAFVAPVPNSVGVGRASASGFEPEPPA
jgi:hypothetical protein